MKDRKIAWYLDEDVLLEGTVKRNTFYPNADKCGFHAQGFDKDMIDKEIFFDLDKAISVCGDVPIIKDNGYYMEIESSAD